MIMTSSSVATLMLIVPPTFSSFILLATLDMILNALLPFS